ncbi:hypothetical protein [Chitinimonas sp.]|uniref:hypothetical protein n=1 Tax=Chitinimonas sp. TaxID=1934313 RepID=UPI0035AD8CD8
MYRDIKRILPLLIVAALLIGGASWFAGLIGRPELAASLQWIGIAVAATGVAHIQRRILLPKIDLQALGSKASEQPTGAGLAFLGLCYLVATLIQTLAAVSAR